MIYSLTDKLKFDENPKLEIKKGKYVEVKSDAETVLTLLSIVQDKGEDAAVLEAVDLLFSEKDKKLLKQLQWEDFATIISTAMNIAVGYESNEEDSKLGEA